MSYIIYTSSGTVLTTVATGKINTNTTSLSLVGRNVNNYGQFFNQNLVDLLTNFASPSYLPPQYPTQGQLWYDITSNRLKVYNNRDGFVTVNAPVISDTQPVGQLPGDFWYDPTEETLNFMNSDGQYVIMITFPKNDLSGWTHPHIAIHDVNTNTQEVTLLKSYGNVIGALTTASFTASNADSVGTFVRAGTQQFSAVSGLTIIGDIKATDKIWTDTLEVDSTIASLSDTSANAVYVKGGVGIDGSVYIKGSLKVDGVQTIVNSTQTSIVDPVIDVGTNIDNAPLTAVDIFDKGICVHYNALGGTANDNHAFMGFEHTQGRFMFKEDIYPGGNALFPLDDLLNTGTYSAVDLGEIGIRGTGSNAILFVDTNGFNVTVTAPPALHRLRLVNSTWNFNNDGTLVAPGNITSPLFNGDLNGNASSASKWVTARSLALGGDLSGSVSIDGTTDITLTATVGAIYSANAGITLTNRTFGHTNAVTADTASEGGSNRTLTFGETFYIPSVTYDAQGHVTGKGSVALTLPAAQSFSDTNTTYGISAVDVAGGKAIRLTDSSSNTDDVTFAAGSNVTLTRVGDTITIASSYTDTTYSAGTGLALSGTTFNHSNSVTADTASEGGASRTLSFGGTFNIPSVTYDAQGHVTGKGSITLTMPTSPADNNTTYSISAETTTGGANLRLTGSDSSTDNVKLASGSNVTITRTDADTITIASADTNTTYGISAETVSGGANLRLTGSDSSTDNVKLAAGSNVTITRTDADTITIASSYVDTNTTYSAGTGLALSSTTFNHSNSVTADTAGEGGASRTLAYGGTFNIPSVTYDAQGHVTGKGSVTLTMPSSPADTLYDAGTLSGAITLNRNNGTIQKVLLNGNITSLAISNISAGQSFTVIFTQDGTGSRTLTAGGSFKFASGYKTLSTVGNSIDMLNVFYDGSTYYCTLTTGYA
jgi:putative lipase involved disintegration of autophagic bodies